MTTRSGTSRHSHLAHAEEILSSSEVWSATIGPERPLRIDGWHEGPLFYMAHMAIPAEVELSQRAPIVLSLVDVRKQKVLAVRSVAFSDWGDVESLESIFEAADLDQYISSRKGFQFADGSGTKP